MNSSEKSNSYSVAIVTWNREIALIKSVNSILNQTILPKEVVIVNNNSSYDVSLSLNEFSDNAISNGINVLIINTHKNLGCPIARNLAFANCSSEYIYALDDDGWLEEHAIENALDVFSVNQSAVVVASVIICPESNDMIGNRAKGVERKNLFSAGAALYKKSYLTENGYFPDYFRQMEESHFSMKMYNTTAQIFAAERSIMYHQKSVAGRIRYIEVSNNFINEIKNIKELVHFPGNIPLFLYKFTSHLMSYYRSSELIRFPKDLIKSIWVIMTYRRSPILSLKDYIDFKRNVIK